MCWPPVLDAVIHHPYPYYRTQHLFPQQLGELANDTLQLSPSSGIPQPKGFAFTSVMLPLVGRLHVVTDPFP